MWVAGLGWRRWEEGLREQQREMRPGWSLGGRDTLADYPWAFAYVACLMLTDMDIEIYIARTSLTQLGYLSSDIIDVLVFPLSKGLWGGIPFRREGRVGADITMLLWRWGKNPARGLESCWKSSWLARRAGGGRLRRGSSVLGGVEGLLCCQTIGSAKQESTSTDKDGGLCVAWGEWLRGKTLME